MSELELFPDLDQQVRVYRTGILPSQEIRRLIALSHVMADPAIVEDQIQPASLDLRLGAVAYRVRASFLPSPERPVTKQIAELSMHMIDLSTPAVLERDCVYIIPLLEELHLPILYSGRANPKSSTGRVDVFTRVITEYGSEFESIPAGYNGKLYLEVAPRTFSVVVRFASRLSQIRFVRGKSVPSDAQMQELHQNEALAYREDDVPANPTFANGLWISVSLSGELSEIVGYRARLHAPVIDLEKIAYYDTDEYWEPIRAGRRNQVILNPGDFYILGSKEKVSVPPGFAAEMVGYDPSVGEFRVHYAGFFDPGFGYGAANSRGTRAVLEVRSHEVPFLLEDGQRVGRLNFERLLTQPDKLYGAPIGSSYQQQKLTLSKHFKGMTLRSDISPGLFGPERDSD
jgi:dCTP deaminase